MRLGKGTAEVKRHIHLESAGLITVGVGLGHLAQAVSVPLPHCAVTLFPVCVLCSLERSYCVQDTPKQWSVVFHLLEGGVSP